MTHLPGNSGIQTPELHPSLSQALWGLGPDMGVFTISPGHAQWPEFCWEPTAAGPRLRCHGSQCPQRSSLPPLSRPSLICPTPYPGPHSGAQAGAGPRARATHLSGPGDSGYTPPPCSLGRLCRTTAQGTGKAGSRRLGLQRGCHRNLASSAHRTGPRCGGRTGRSLRDKISTCLALSEPRKLQREGAGSWWRGSQSTSQQNSGEPSKEAAGPGDEESTSGSCPLSEPVQTV